MDTKKIGGFLRNLRKEQGLTQEELGEKLGATNKTISRWETGTYMPPVDVLLQMSKLYDVSVNEILSGERIRDDKTYLSQAEENIISTLKDTTVVSKRSKKIAIVLITVILALVIVAASLSYYCLYVTKLDVFTVKFDSNGGSNIAAQQVPIHSDGAGIVSEPTAPTKSGYSLVGWYYDKELTARVDFTFCLIKKSITLYAKWERATNGLEYVSEILYGESDVSYGVKSVGTATDKEIIVPSHYNGHPVVRILPNAFRNSIISGITLPNTLRYIDYNAFYNCRYLQDVRFGNGLLEISGGAFSHCSALREVELPATLTQIWSQAFFNSALQSISIPNGVTDVQSEAFGCCYDLTSVTLGSNIVSLDNAFDGSYNIAVVANKSNVELPENSPLANALCFITENGSTDKITLTDDGFLFFYDGGVPILLRYYGSETDVTLPTAFDGKTYDLRDYSFCNSSVKRVVISGDVGKIGVKAFADSKKLTEIRILDGVTEISDSAFENCSSLKQITLSDTIAALGTSVFANCEQLTDIVIPDGVTVIPRNAFINCGSLTNIVFPKQLHTIEWSAFYNCVSLLSISLPKSLTTVWLNPFVGCSSLREITVEEGNPVYRSEGNCLIDYPKKALKLGCANSVIPSDGSVTQIYANAFGGVYGLKSIHIPKYITKIYDGAFHNCKSLDNITVDEENPYYHVDGRCLIETQQRKLVVLLNDGVIPSDGSVSEIGSHIFAKTVVSDIQIPDTVKVIDNSAFEDSIRHGIVLYYNGSLKQAVLIEFGYNYNWLHNVSKIVCSDGVLSRL